MAARSCGPATPSRCPPHATGSPGRRLSAPTRAPTAPAPPAWPGATSRSAPRPCRSLVAVRLLVTGSAGHLGEALVRVLGAEGHDLVGLDVLASAHTHVVGSIA